jgi:nuclear pore complex protein Nup205
MDNLTRLRAALRRTIEQEDSQGSQELYDALQASAPALRRVGRVPAKNAEERREIEGGASLRFAHSVYTRLKQLCTGRTTHRNKPLAVNADFARQALFVADQLSLSERAAASLLHDVAHALPNATSVQIIEHVVVEFDRRRHASADALLLLLQAARAAEDKGSSPLLKRLDLFVKKEIIAEKPGHDALPLVVLAEVDATAQVLAQAQTARTNAISATVIPTTTGEKALSDCYGSPPDAVLRWTWSAQSRCSRRTLQSTRLVSPHAFRYTLPPR